MLINVTKAEMEPETIIYKGILTMGQREKRTGDKRELDLERERDLCVGR